MVHVRWNPVEHCHPAMRTRDVALPDGRTLRVAILDGSLCLAMGRGKGPGWKENENQRLTLPSDVVGRLVVALLDVGGEAEH